MDHYSEQLVHKHSDGKDHALRILIAAGLLIVLFITVLAVIAFSYIPLIIIALGACWLAWYLFVGTMTEYEYIVTNSDMDIDKITGRRKRKRLVTVDLRSVKEWGEYTGNEGGNGVSATVMASDGTGCGSWYLVAEHEKLGRIMVIFSPTRQTVGNINFGVPGSLRKKEAELPEENEEDYENQTAQHEEEEEESTD